MAHYEFNIRDYARIFYKRKFLILLTIVIGVVCGHVLYPKPPPVFESSATVKIEERKTVAGLLSEWIVYNPGDMMASQTKIIKGFPIIRKVALQLGMIDESDHPTDVQKVVSGLQERIETVRVGDTNIIKITAVAGNAIEARDLAKSVSGKYIEENLLEKTQQARGARQFIEEQLSILEDRLKNAEDRLKDFEEETGETDYAPVEDVSYFDPLHEKLVESKLMLATLAQRYTGKHPQIKGIKEQIKNLELRLEKEKHIIPRPKENLSGQKLDRARLSREVEVNKKLYMMFKEKLEESRINEAQKVGDVSIVDPAILPGSPVDMQANMNVLIGALMGLLLGIGIAFLLESMDTSIGTIEDIEHVVNLPVLGVVSSAKKELDKAQINHIRNASHVDAREAQEIYIRMITHYEPKSLIAEACRNIRTNLKLGPSNKVILVTSSGTQEGKSTILVNLSLAVAQTGAKTLIVSADLRRPTIAKTFGVRRDPGVTDYLSGAISRDEAFRNISDFMLGHAGIDNVTKVPGLENLSILPCGKLPDNPAEVLESKEWTTLIQELKEEFDFIFLDSPPVLPVTDASIIASEVDSVVLCYEMGRISREALLRAKNQIESVGSRVSGIILNQIKAQTHALEPYPYYASYKYRYYREDKPVGNGKNGKSQNRSKDRVKL